MSGRKGIGHYSAATKEEVVRLFLEERMIWFSHYRLTSSEFCGAASARITQLGQILRKPGENLRPSLFSRRLCRKFSDFEKTMERMIYPLLFLGVNLYNTDI